MRAVLRRADPDDVPSLITFLRQAASETDFADVSLDELGVPVATAQQHIRSGQQCNNQLFLLADLGDHFAGMLTFSGGLWRRNRHAGELSMTVLKHYWGMGLGGLMVDFLFDWARSLGTVTKIHLRVRTDNLRAIALYERKGFIREGVSQSDMLVEGKYFDHIRMGVFLS